MHDPFPIASPLWLQEATKPLAYKLDLPTLPYHIHEIIIAFTFYQVIHSYIAPWLSQQLVPTAYNNFNARTKLNWNVHIVSFVQSVIVNSTALYLMFFDEERKEMNWAGRIWGYDGASGMLQGIAGGYFIWDLIITIRHVEVFGVGMLMHAISAVTVFSLGFRPFLNYYGPVFILYELSSPALNIHWFMDKLKLTGSIYQLLNGIVLITTFFSCRLVWGSINSVFVFRDVWKAMQNQGPSTSSTFGHDKPALAAGTTVGAYEDIMRFAGSRALPTWLALSYLASNIVLNCLNYYWFGKMIETLRSRFEPPLGTKGVGASREKTETSALDDKAAQQLPQEIEIQKGVFEDGRKTIEIQGRELRSRRRG